LDCHPVSVVQYTFTHKQYTERHNDITIRMYINITVRIHNLQTKTEAYKT